jgi:hypothetical protein
MYEAKGRSGLIISVVDDEDSFRCSLTSRAGSALGNFSLTLG